jgi:methylglutaconyl-CoA hydratase
VDRYVRALLRGAPAALAGVKDLLRRGRPDDLTRWLAGLSELSVRFFHSPEAMEGISAFRAKRDPDWVPRG